MTRKISQSVARIHSDSKELVVLSTRSAVKEWGYVMDYVEGMWMMLQQDYQDNFVLGTGESHTGRNLLKLDSKRSTCN